MSQGAIARRRLVHQQIARPVFAQPDEVVAWLGAMQAQDYLGALWAVGLRTPGATEQSIERALAERRVVRTWPMRGTIHFVAAADVRWMLDLLAPRMIQRSQGRLRQLGLDAETIAAGAEAVGRALAGGRQLTRPALYQVLEEAGIDAGGSRGLHILGQLAHRQLICFGARDGKQPTFTLLDEWVPEARPLPRDEALATLTLRYFRSHGPATAQDFGWWAGLTTADARAGLGAVEDQLERMVIDGQTHYADRERPPADDAPTAFLLPPFDEFLVAYRDRRASPDPDHSNLVVPGGNGIFNPIVVIGGRVVGTWRRTIKPGRIEVSFSPFTAWSDVEAEAARAAAESYGRFLGLRAAFDDG